MSEDPHHKGRLGRFFGRGRRDSAKLIQNGLTQGQVSSDIITRPSAHTVPSTTTAPPALQSTAKPSTSRLAARPVFPETTVYSSQNDAVVKAAVEISQTTTSNPTTDAKDDLAKGPSLWDTAYDALKKEDYVRIAAYEDLLSRVPARPQGSAAASHKTEDPNEVTNQIPQHNTIARREKLRQITELGLKHMEDRKVSATLLGHEIVLQDVVANVAGAVEWAEDYIKDAVKDLPYASIILAGISLVLPLLKNPSAAEASNQDGFIYVTSQMRYYVAMESLLLPKHMKSDLNADLMERLMDLYKLIIDFQVQTVLRFYRSRTKNFFRGTINYDSWEKKLQYMKDSDKELVQKFETAMSATSLGDLKRLAEEAETSRTILSSLLKKQQELININFDQLGVAQDHLSFTQKMDRRMSNADNRACLQDLQATDPRDDKKRIEQDKGGLLRDLYHWVLENSDFQQWRDDGQTRLLWIRGDPGKGKTMLLCGIIDELIKSTTYSANTSFFFCQATNADINNATAVLRGLIYILVKQQPSLISHLRESYDDFGKRRFTGANAWVALSKIFSGILSDPRLQSTYLVVDGLDECTTDLKLLLDLIQNSLVYPTVKWIVSSRNWPSIEKGLNNATQKANLSLELNEKSVSTAVISYIRFKVDWLATRNEYDNSTRDAVQRYLSLNANGTFLWVALVCEELADTSGWEAKEMLTAFPPGLDALYRQMIDQICSSRNATLCKCILAVVSVVYRPITLDQLESFVDMPPQSSGNYKVLAEIIGLCGSFLILRERTISFVHQSAKEFLIEKASQEIFLSRIEDKHDAIFSRSLQVMSRTLRRDVYSLRAPGVSISQVKQPYPDPLAAARYSCLYWADHMLECKTRGNTRNELKDNGSVHKFLCENFLFWLEALSLIGGLSSGIVMISNLENRLNANETPNLYAFVHDAKRFALFNRLVIEETPLQIYCSALVFAPERSIIRAQFEECIPAWIQTKPKVQAEWGAALQTLEGHSNMVGSVAFSPDGQRVVSGSVDKTVRLWDAITGTALQKLEGYSHAVCSVAFWPDGQHIVSGSLDRTVGHWDTLTGLSLQTLEGHLGEVSSIAFSRDGQRVVSGWGDMRMQLWGEVSSIAFSSDGQRVVSGSGDKTVRLWDTMTGAVLQTLEGHLGPVGSVAFSPDGQRVVSGSVDKTVRLWDAIIGVLLYTLEGHLDEVSSIAFSPNGQRIVSGSWDKTIRLWDTITGTALQILKGHLGPVYSVAFSCDGQRIVSGSRDMTVRLWDAILGVALQTLEGHTHQVGSVAFSRDGQRIVSGSADRTVRLWDATTGTALQTPEGHLGPVCSIAFSRDGQRVVSGSDDNTVRLWDAMTGIVLHTLKGHSGEVNSIDFSPNDQRVVSGSWDKTVRLWDTMTGAALQKLEGHLGIVRSVAFSSDGQRVVSGSEDKTVRLWDTITGTVLQTLEGHLSGVMSVAFSSDGQRVVSGSSDNTVRLWDAITGMALRTLEGHSGPVYSVAFSRDGQRVVSGSLINDWTVRLWDAITGAELQTFESYLNNVNSVVFLPDGKVEPGLFVFGNWIIQGKEKIIWLPPEYRATCQAVENTVIVLGHSSGKISIFGFTEGLRHI